MNGLKKPVVIDGLIYSSIAFFTAWSIVFTTDDAAKYIAPVMLFWLRSICQALGVLLVTLKGFRSTSFAEHLDEKKSETAFLQRQLATKPNS